MESNSSPHSSSTTTANSNPNRMFSIESLLKSSSSNSTNSNSNVTTPTSTSSLDLQGKPSSKDINLNHDTVWSFNDGTVKTQQEPAAVGFLQIVSLYFAKNHLENLQRQMPSGFILLYH
jgi:hypothetical protein